MAEEIEMVDVLVDISEHDVYDLFADIVNNDDEMTWTFESAQGHQVNITFRKEPDE